MAGVVCVDAGVVFVGAAGVGAGTGAGVKGIAGRDSVVLMTDALATQAGASAIPYDLLRGN